METTGSLLRFVGATSSFCSGALAEDFQTQLRALYGTEGRALEICVQRVQQQQGGADCGFFSIAYAYCLAAGEDLTKINFNQPQMRKHLAEWHCLKNNLTFL